jgi:diadenylate cyclase
MKLDMAERALCRVCTEKRGVDAGLLEKVIILAVEIAREGREGREGRRIGTIFVVADSEEVLQRSQNLILAPLLGHPAEIKRLDDPNMRETIKELAQLDGAFIVSNEGIVISACRYLNAFAGQLHLPLGLGARHMAAAAMSKVTKAVSVVVSESSIVRVFDDGELIAEIIPELWLFNHQNRDQFTVVAKAEA